MECTHFLDCIREGRQPLTDGDEGVRVLKILNASQMSLDEFGRQIDLSDASASSAQGAPSETKAPAAGPNAFVHPSAVIDDEVTIGDSTKIWHFCHVLSHSVIGRKCNIGQNVVIGPDVRIGDGCKIQNNVSVYKGVTLENGVFCGPSMVFTNIFNPRAAIGKMDQVRPTLVKTGATIGANATIVCGTTLGKYCFVGAGAVVTRNVPDHALVMGNPAKHTGWMCHCGERLSDDLECQFCGNEYQKQSNGLVVAKKRA
jgi:UDP-2-acetamido-3-amino-2,3-dideoxy-glucuronate N-acetyltransferase